MAEAAFALHEWVGKCFGISFSAMGRYVVIECLYEAVVDSCRIVVPPEIGYPENNMDLKGPKPITFSVSTGV